MAARGTLGKGFKGMLLTNPFFNVWVGEAYLFLFSNKGCDKLKRKKQRNKTKTLLLIVGIPVALILGLVLSGNLYIDSLLNKTIRSRKLTDEDAMINQEVLDQVKNHHIVNIALFGSDNARKAQWNDYEMERADATKIISLDFDAKKIKITSLQRDTLIWIPEPYNDYEKLNHAHWRGGPELAVKMLNYNFDLDITQYVGFSFEAFSHLVDLVGGVDFVLPEGLLSQMIYDIGAREENGVYHLNGEQTTYYCRIRETDDDFHRMDRQNEVILKIIEKLSKKNLIELMDIVNEMLPYIETNLTNNEIKNYVSSLLSFDLKHLDQFQIPSKGMDSIEKVIEYNGFSPIYMMENYEDLAKELHWNIYEDEDYQPSSTIIQLEQNIQREFGS
ncbi:cell envelope-like function transcriptional attenuator common domain protein [Holdemania filiformis DSM 12042]|uniref:Cell envelope-like function transcriptional attenuator common domain protein n=1 Tax=Holdemania filiformis DSM 12042 TaxID=545696 RepID=B9Y7C7_9FIRM|nr:cell envelope-like function transcriptional attenuator common domain protein [Holdemania filiformis DSM 12042]